MARRGDGIYLRKNTWWLDAVIHGRRYQMSLGKNIKRSDAAEIVMVKRAGILKGELGIGRKKADISFGEGLTNMKEKIRFGDLKGCKQK